MPNSSRTDEQRRHFSRVLFNSAASLAMDGETAACEILDLSLKGALVRMPAPERAATPGTSIGKEVILLLQLNENDSIRMEADIAHMADGRAGLRCLSIDLDSISHLRRLVELNVGDDAILQRELAALVAEI